MAFAKIRKFLKIIKKQIPIIIFFGTFFLILTAISYFDRITDCFPVTVITVDQSIISEIIKIEGVCDSRIFSEKMTFDSSIFNHYETPPVKDIFFLSVNLPYSEWSNLKETENATVEANPFVESVVVSFYNSRLKWLTLSFIVIFILGLFLFAASIPSKKESSKIFKANTVATSLIFIFSTVTAFMKFPAKTFLFSVLSLSSVLTIYVLFLVLYYGFVMEKQPVTRTKIH